MTNGRSIGQVLELLQPEFPDVTISKIRFLESKGLVTPQRSASGYRRFADADIDRLRWVLTQQRDRFLPLRVIRQLLETGAWRHDDPTASAPHQPDADASLADLPDQLFSPTDDTAHPLVRTARNRRLKRRELLEESGLQNDQLRSLEQLGLVETSADLEGRTFFDDEALAVAHLAARFWHHGIEPRHLRAYKVGAEREAALFEQLLLGQLGRSDDDSATATLAHLVTLGTELRAVLLRRALREHLSADEADPATLAGGGENPASDQV